MDRSGSVRRGSGGPFATRSFANDPGCANLNPDDDSSPLKRRERSMTGAATDGEPHVLMEANVDEVCVGAAWRDRGGAYARVSRMSEDPEACHSCSDCVEYKLKRRAAGNLSNGRAG